MIQCNCGTFFSKPISVTALIDHHRAGHGLSITPLDRYSAADYQEIRVRLIAALMPYVVPEYIDPAAWKAGKPEPLRSVYQRGAGFDIQDVFAEAMREAYRQRTQR